MNRKPYMIDPSGNVLYGEDAHENVISMHTWIARKFFPKAEFPELPDSPVLIGDAIDTAIKALRDLDEAKDWLKGSTFLIHSDGWKKDIDILLKKLE